VKLVGILVVAGAAALALFAGRAGATNECRGFQVCAPVSGPWVVVPASVGFPRPSAKWELSCPKGFVVGGTDAELTDHGIDVTFDAILGSPVNPGISTKRSALFTGTAVEGPARTASYRPHIGCLPAAGGGSRVPTVAHVVRPGHPTVHRVSNVKVHQGRQVVRKTCPAGGSLVDMFVSRGFYGQTPPTARLVSSVQVVHSVANGRVTVVITAGAAVQSTRTVVQVNLTCTGGGT
jgi:hypothetical protein